MRLLPVLLLLALAAPLALAQQHEHGAGEAFVVIAHDVPPDGRAVVGNVAHFAAILMGEEGVPAFHHNMEIVVKLNGQVLFATTPASGHDYDGINGFDLVFPTPGVYNITAKAEGREDAVGYFEGYVVEAQDPIPATLVLEGPDEFATFEPVEFTYRIVDAQGNLLPHTDAIFEIRRQAGAGVEFRVHTHSHEEAQTLRYVSIAAPGEREVQVVAFTAFPEKGAGDFRSFTTTKTITTTPGPPVEPPAPVVPEVNPMRNYVGMGDAGSEYLLLTTFDPYTLVGIWTQVRVNALVVDAETLAPVQHVDFKATLRNPLGQEVFHSESLHEYDGILEVLTGNQGPGQYVLDVEASRGSWKGTAQARYTVAPPVVPLSAGPYFVRVEGLEALESGKPSDLVVVAHNGAGVPFIHSDVDLQVFPDREGAAPILATKLHTHDDGLFPFTLAFPEPGPYVIRLAPFGQEARPVPIFFREDGSPALDFAFEVAEGLPLPQLPLPLEGASEPAPAPVPGFEAALLLAGAAVALAVRRRR